MTFLAKAIVRKAYEMGVEISLKGDNLKLGSDNPIPPKVKEVAIDHKPLIVDYLRSQQSK